MIAAAISPVGQAVFRPERMVPPSRFELVCQLVAEEYGIARADLLQPAGRAFSECRPRQIAMWLAYRWTVLSAAEIGRRFGRAGNTVQHAVNLLEKGHRGTLGRDFAVSRALDRQCVLWGWTVPPCKRRLIVPPASPPNNTPPNATPELRLVVSN